MLKTTKTYRFDESTLAIIDELKASLNISNNSEVLRRAITLLKLASDNQLSGGSICLKNSNSMREILI